MANYSDGMREDDVTGQLLFYFLSVFFLGVNCGGFRIYQYIYHFFQHVEVPMQMHCAERSQLSTTHEVQGRVIIQNKLSTVGKWWSKSYLRPITKCRLKQQKVKRMLW